MKYLVCIFRQFRQEINETLATNLTLLQEIIYDTKKFEKGLKDGEHDTFEHSEGVAN